MSAEVKKVFLDETAGDANFYVLHFASMEDPLLGSLHLTMKSQHRQAGPDLLELGGKAAA